MRNIGSKLSYSYLLILLVTACVDRLQYDISKPANYGISISGFISDQPGPYQISITSVFDIESKESTRLPVSVKSLTLFDNLGNSESLREVNDGVYRTNPSGMRGVAGGVYTLRIELFDGKIYESLPDTILTPWPLDSLYGQFNVQYNNVGMKEYTYDVLFDASVNEKGNKRLMWKFEGTFQAETHPEVGIGECVFLAEIGKCNFVPACSGYRNVGSNARPVLEKKFPCTCCICWYDLHNNNPILSDVLFTRSKKLTGIKIYSIPLNEWTLWHKIHVAVAQRSLTHNSFRFFKAIRDQQNALGDLFQPISGKIPSNFIQVSGTPTPIMGIFFATSISTKAKYVQRFGLPPYINLPPNIVHAISLDKPFAQGDCRLKFPNSTNTKPFFWED